MPKSLRVDFRLDRGTAKSLSAQIVDHYREEIFSGRIRTGDCLPTRQALVAGLGCSKNVIQSAVSKLTAEGLIRPRPRVGCEVVRPEGRKIRGRVLGVFAGSAGAYSAAIFSETFAARMRASGLQCGMVSIPRLPNGKMDYSWLEQELTLRPDIAIIDACRLSAPRVVRILERSGVPYALLYAKQVRVGSNCLARISRDPADAMKELVADCRKAGVRSVCFVGFGRDSFLEPCSVLESSGMFVERLTVPLGAVFSDLNGIQEAARKIVSARIRKGSLCDLFFFGDDYLTFGALPAILEAGLRIPEDVRIVSMLNRGFGPCLSRSMAGLSYDSHDFASQIADGVSDWFRTGKFPSGLRFVPTYVRGGTFPI